MRIQSDEADQDLGIPEISVGLRAKSDDE